jgi:alcohol dehydrogenase class IV
VMSQTGSAGVWRVATRVVGGRNAVDRIGPECRALGSAPLLVTDDAVGRLPVADLVRRELALHGVSRAAEVRVPPSPALADVSAAVVQAAQVAPDCVVALGGGSVIDAAKVIALCLTNASVPDRVAGWPHGLLDLDDEPLRPGLPVLAVPTTAATGSEVNGVAALLVDGDRLLLTSGWLVPRTALVDPDLTATLPARDLIAGGLETLLRVLCPYVADSDQRAGRVVDGVAEGLMEAMCEVLDRLAADPGDAAARAELSRAATLTGAQVDRVGRDPWAHGLWYLQNPLCHRLGTSKGMTMAALLPTYLSDIAGGGPWGSRFGSPQRLARTPLGRGSAGARDVAEATRERLARWGLPSALPAGVAGPVMDAAAAEAHRRWSTAGPLAGAAVANITDFYRRCAGEHADAALELPAVPPVMDPMTLGRR